MVVRCPDLARFDGKTQPSRPLPHRAFRIGGVECLGLPETITKLLRALSETSSLEQ